MNQHTPGPWKVYPSGTQTFVASVATGRIVAVDLYDENSNPPIEEVDANARLIAAAPALLEAVEAALKFIQEGDSEPSQSYSVVALLKRTLKQAQGENNE